MARKYYTLLIADTKGGKWHIDFGDYDREVVEEEASTKLDPETFDDLPKAQKKIIATGPKQADINAAVAKLNASRA